MLVPTNKGNVQKRKCMPSLQVILLLSQSHLPNTRSSYAFINKWDEAIEYLRDVQNPPTSHMVVTYFKYHIPSIVYTKYLMD